MKRFTFTLQTLLEIRGKKEEAAKTSLGAVTSMCVRTDQELEIIAHERMRAMRLCTPQDGWDLGRVLEMRSRYLSKIDEVARILTEKRAKLELQREKAAAEYREAHRELRVLQKIREKQYEQHRALAAKEEQRENDDIANALSIHSNG